MGRAKGELKLREIHSAQRVRERIDSISAAVEADYAGLESAPLLVVIAEGAIRFANGLADGLKRRGLVPELRIVRARRTVGTRLEEVEVEELDPGVFRGRDVVVTDDIADEGRTLAAVLELVRSGAPSSVRVAVLVNKLSRRSTALQLDYIGFEIPDGWVVGYGMDMDGDYRDLDNLAILEP